MNQRKRDCHIVQSNDNRGRRPEGCRSGFNSARTRIIMLCIGLMIVCCGETFAANVREWSLTSFDLQARATSALLRYYSVLRADSLQVRYIRQNSGRFPYKIRAQVTDNDSLGRMLLLSLGQLRLFSTENIRIALGDDLYEELLRSRFTPGTVTNAVDLGDSFDHTDWTGDHHVTWSIWERLDVRVDPELNLFVGIGAPESNLGFWDDGTGRVGIAAPGWEFAALFPFASGSTGIGPFRPRLLAPGFGGTGTLRYEGMEARLRFTGFQDIAEESTRKLDRLFVHSLSGEMSYHYDLSAAIGGIRLTGGVSYEEFTELKERDGELIQDGYVRRFSPMIGVRYTTSDENIRLNAELYDIAVRAGVSLRLTQSLWFELRAVSNDILREAKPFEHPFSLFFTPMVKF